ncbi:MAG: FGGY family carbohydrate kinase [Spirochaetes bacterium]|nr:FGGY family carbohydrate kinase [Spirochaetota bacterium]
MAKTIVAYDLGTGGAKASLYDVGGACLASTFVPYETLYPDTGWHEQRPADWWDAVVKSTRALLAESRTPAADVECLAISGQSLAVIPVDAAGSPLRESIPIWSDTRASAQTAAFFREVDRTAWYLATGNGFPAECYSVFKIMWYRDNEPALLAKARLVLGSKDWLNLRLTGKAFTDFSYASGTGVYDLAGWKYHPGFMRASGLPESLFPEIVPSTRIIGNLTAGAADALGLPRSVKVACGGVDNSCMALGARNTGEGRVYTSLGSSSWIAVSSAKPVLDPVAKPYVFTHVIPGLFTSAVSIFSGGSSFRWIRDAVLGGEAVAEYDAMNEIAAASPVGANRLLFNPSLAGGSSQEPSPRIRGAFAGIDLRHTRADLVRAGMEGIAMNLGAVLEVLRRFVPLAPEMLMVGGGSRSRLWLQIFADVFRMDCVKTNVDQDAASLGAAAVAAVGAGLWKDFGKVDEAHRVQDVCRPIPANVEKYRRLMPAFEMLRRQQAELGELLHGIDLG